MILNYLIIIVFLILGLYYIYPTKYNKEDYLNYIKCKKKGHNKVTKEIFNKYNFNRIDKDNWDLYIPCGYNGIEKEMKKIKVTNNKQIIFGINGCDKIVAKDFIWKLMVKKYGRLYSKDIMPDTYIVKNTSDRQLFYQQFDKKKIYILKKNIQRQAGLKISNNIDEINSDLGIFTKYRVIQELLQDPFILNKRKINLRVYLLIICDRDKITAYIHKGGFMYYTPKHFKKHTLDRECHITSGYVPRRVYQENPLTLVDFKNWLIKNGYNSVFLFNNIEKLFKTVMEAISGSICSGVLNNNVKFQLFGADVAPDENLKCKLIEINKGPDMGAKDERDKKVKFAVQEDIFDLLGLIKTGRINNFKKIWTKYHK